MIIILHRLNITFIHHVVKIMLGNHDIFAPSTLRFTTRVTYNKPRRSVRASGGRSGMHAPHHPHAHDCLDRSNYSLHAFTAGADLASGELATSGFLFSNAAMARYRLSPSSKWENNYARAGDVARSSQIARPAPASIYRACYMSLYVVACWEPILTVVVQH
jgi:hypothetical protein